MQKWMDPGRGAIFKVLNICPASPSVLELIQSIKYTQETSHTSFLLAFSGHAVTGCGCSAAEGEVHNIFCKKQVLPGKPILFQSRQLLRGWEEHASLLLSSLCGLWPLCGHRPCVTSSTFSLRFWAPKALRGVLAYNIFVSDAVWPSGKATSQWVPLSGLL